MENKNFFFWSIKCFKAFVARLWLQSKTIKKIAEFSSWWLSLVTINGRTLSSFLPNSFAICVIFPDMSELRTQIASIIYRIQFLRIIRYELNVNSVSRVNAKSFRIDLLGWLALADLYLFLDLKIKAIVIFWKKIVISAPK